jgi:hypothetical protein
MKYWFGTVCILVGAWLVYRALAHRRAVVRALARAETERREPQISRQLRGLQAMRTGLAPLFVLLILFGGAVLSALWFALDRERILSPVDILAFLAAICAYAYSMFVRLKYSALGFDTSLTD